MGLATRRSTRAQRWDPQGPAGVVSDWFRAHRDADPGGVPRHPPSTGTAPGASGRRPREDGEGPHERRSWGPSGRPCGFVGRDGHAPLRGATSAWQPLKDHLLFQHTHPCGVRLRSIRLFGGTSTPVSIHAPLRGATTHQGRTPESVLMFQYTHPCGVRRRSCAGPTAPFRFQYTHPCGVRLPKVVPEPTCPTTSCGPTPRKTISNHTKDASCGTIQREPPGISPAAGVRAGTSDRPLGSP